MEFFKNMKVSWKLSILIALAVISSAVVGYTGYHYLLKANTDMTVMYKEKLIPVQLLNEERAHARAFQADMLELMITTDNNRNNELKKDMDIRSEKFSNNLTEYEKKTWTPMKQSDYLNLKRSCKSTIRRELQRFS